MAYQNVATPRFYINASEFLSSTGGQSLRSPQLSTLPVIPTKTNNIENISLYGMTSSGFVMVLGHNINSLSSLGQKYWLENYGSVVPITSDIRLNATINSDKIKPNKDGFTITSFSGSGTMLMDFKIDSFDYEQGRIGSIVIGTYYNMPASPNLVLSLSYEYGGIHEQTTKDGSSFSNAFYTKPPKWGNLNSWEIADVEATIEFPEPTTYSGLDRQPLSRSGRRVWDLSFSHISDSNLFGSNQMLSYNAESITTDMGYESDDIQDIATYKYNLLNDDSFFSQVWHKTLGGTLPFIFQPDKDNLNPDQFAICKFDKASLKVAQSAFNVYDISVVIEEAW